MPHPNTESKANKVRLDFAKAVRMARANKRWSQTEVARQAGTGVARVSEIENEVSDPRLSTVARIAAVLGISITISVDEAA